jgi:hypothetical protein
MNQVPVKIDEPRRDPFLGKWLVVWYDAENNRHTESTVNPYEAQIRYALLAEKMAGRLRDVVA